MYFCEFSRILFTSLSDSGASWGVAVFCVLLGGCHQKRSAWEKSAKPPPLTASWRDVHPCVTVGDGYQVFLASFGHLSHLKSLLVMPWQRDHSSAVTRIRTWVVSATTRSTNHYTITAIAPARDVAPEFAATATQRSWVRPPGGAEMKSFSRRRSFLTAPSLHMSNFFILERIMDKNGWKWRDVLLHLCGVCMGKIGTKPLNCEVLP